MGVTRQNHQLMLPFTEVEAGEARGNHRQGAEASTAAYETERPVSSMGRHITDRTAVYGPVCTVVWEGSGREARPYPDPVSSPPKGAPPPDWTDHQSCRP